MSLLSRLFLSTERRLRNGWWCLVFFLILALLVVPAVVIGRQHGIELSPLQQALLVAAASWICQLLRRKPFTELTGHINGRWLKELFLGVLAGSALMLAPALVLLVSGAVRWEVTHAGLSALRSGLLLFVGVALAEELLFRGFLFQRLCAGLGVWPAQIILAGYFLLTHANNPGMAGPARLWASTNIFLASIMFGLAFLRTGSLAMPLGLHFAANWVQGGVLGFGVSGEDQTGLLKPVFDGAPVWLSGGQFGLEASAPGLMAVLAMTLLLWKSQFPPSWRASTTPVGDTA